ncbi:very short patch repair endonuclease [Nocardia sp. NPDC058379]|uniref:very short patch repair endonuclease n=2 Tax=unclassified Nocardia TaxID=2637762 RepID=UPI003664A05B
MGLLPAPTDTAGSWASAPAVRAVMRGNKSRNTKPELTLRKYLWARGLRYRVDARPLPQLRRRADVVFVGARVAVFVDGCFWHGCPDHHRPSRKNAEFWEGKIADNRERDADTDVRLVEAGWTVLRIWEHEDPAAAAIRVEDAVLQHRHNPSANTVVRTTTSARPRSP